VLAAASIWVTAVTFLPAKTAYVEASRGLVDIGHWIRASTSPDARIAIRDVGAVGYWSDRHVLDLAGLASPEAREFVAGREDGCSLIARERITHLVILHSDTDWRECPFALEELHTVPYPVRNLSMDTVTIDSYSVWRVLDGDPGLNDGGW
jgi:hypothetical protein